MTAIKQRSRPATRAIGLRRLEKLADYLWNPRTKTEVPPETFDMAYYHLRQWSSESGFGNPLPVAVKNARSGKPTCGTTGCAMGHAVIVFPNLMCFNEQGAPTLKAKPEATEYEAGVAVFSVSQEEYIDLFMPRDKPQGPKQVAARIRAFVRREMASRAND